MGKKQITTLTSPHFPNSFTSPFLITSEEDDTYNCMAWSVHDTERWWDWEEDAFWIEGIARDGKLTTFEWRVSTWLSKDCSFFNRQNSLYTCSEAVGKWKLDE